MGVPVQENRERDDVGSRDEGIEDEDGLSSKQQKTSDRSLKGTKTQKECILSASPRFPKVPPDRTFLHHPKSQANKG